MSGVKGFKIMLDGEVIGEVTSFRYEVDKEIKSDETWFVAYMGRMYANYYKN